MHFIAAGPKYHGCPPSHSLISQLALGRSLVRVERPFPSALEVTVPSRSGLPGNCLWRFPSAAARLAVTCGGSLMRQFP